MEKRLNQEELDKLGQDYKTQKVLVDNLMSKYKAKQVELDEIRQRAAEQNRGLAVELGRAQSETNILIMELKKYEGISNFMTLEKELILRAMEDAKCVDPGLAARGLDESDQRRLAMEQEISRLQKEWQTQLDLVRQESDRVLGDDEVKEFKTRIAVLSEELESKQ